MIGRRHLLAPLLCAALAGCGGPSQVKSDAGPAARSDGGSFDAAGDGTLDLAPGIAARDLAVIDPAAAFIGAWVYDGGSVTTRCDGGIGTQTTTPSGSFTIARMGDKLVVDQNPMCPAMDFTQSGMTATLDSGWSCAYSSADQNVVTSIGDATATYTTDGAGHLTLTGSNTTTTSVTNPPQTIHCTAAIDATAHRL